MDAGPWPLRCRAVSRETYPQYVRGKAHGMTATMAESETEASFLHGTILISFFCQYPRQNSPHGNPRAYGQLEHRRHLKDIYISLQYRQRWILDLDPGIVTDTNIGDGRRPHPVCLASTPARVAWAGSRLSSSTQKSPDSPWKRSVRCSSMVMDGDANPPLSEICTSDDKTMT